MGIYRHPPRVHNGKTTTEKVNNSKICNFKISQQREYSYVPTDEEEKSFDEKDGYLQYLLKEVINNGFENDLYIPEDEKRKKNNPSILKIVDEKMNHEKHKAMGCPLNRAEMLSLVLYTGCEVNWYFSEDQRNENYDKWKWMDYC